MHDSDAGPIPKPVITSDASNSRRARPGSSAPRARPAIPRAIRPIPTIAVVRKPSRTTTLAATVTLIAHEKNSGVMTSPACAARPPRTPWT